MPKFTSFQKRPYFLLVFLLLFQVACANTTQATVQVTEQPPPTETPSQRGSGDTLHILYHQAPTILNPHLSNAAKDWAASRIIYEPLASYDKDGNLIPFLAAEIPSLENGGLAEDGRSVTWKLKQNILWSDGQPFTADDVLFTYEYITNPDTGAVTRDSYSTIETVEIIDDYTVKLNFKNINPAWSIPFVGLPGMILPRHIFQEFNGTEAKTAPPNWAPIGTGPYRVITDGFRREEFLLLGNELVETTRVVYEPNPFFRDPDKPYFSRVELRGGGTPQEAARLVLLTGEVDYAWNLQLGTAVLAEFEETAEFGQVVANLGPNVERIPLNRTDPNVATADGERSSLLTPHPFLGDQDPTNQLVRQAFTLAIDRDRIAELYPGSVATSNVLLSPANFASPNTSYRFDLQAAAALLDEAGWVDNNGDGFREKNGLPLRILFRTSNDSVRLATLSIIEDDWESIGIEVRIEPIDSTNFLNRQNENSTFHFYSDMQLLFTPNPSPDPSAYMARWTSAQIPQMSNSWAGFNRERWQNAEYDALFLASQTELDPEKRQQLFIQMNDLIINNVVTIPLVYRAQLSGVSNTLVGVDLTPWDADVWNIQDWRRTP